MDARPLLGFLAIAGLATTAIAQGPGIQFEATNRATFIYVQEQGDYRPFLLNVSTVVHIDPGFVLSTDSKNQVDSFLGETVGVLPNASHPTEHSITMRVYWALDPTGGSSVLPSSSVMIGSGKTTVFRSNIIVGDDSGNVPLKLTAITFTAN